MNIPWNIVIPAATAVLGALGGNVAPSLYQGSTQPQLVAQASKPIICQCQVILPKQALDVFVHHEK